MRITDVSPLLRIPITFPLHSGRMHLKTVGLKRCTNPEISGRLIEPFILKLIEDVLVKPKELRKYLIVNKGDSTKLRKQVEVSRKKQEQIESEKHDLLNSYATAQMAKEIYIKQSVELDNEINLLTLQQKELLGQIPDELKDGVINTSLQIFCSTAKARFSECKDFESKRHFCLDYIEKIIYEHRNVEVHGSVPVYSNLNDKIKFCITSRI